MFKLNGDGSKGESKGLDFEFEMQLDDEETSDRNTESFEEYQEPQQEEGKPSKKTKKPKKPKEPKKPISKKTIFISAGVGAILILIIAVGLVTSKGKDTAPGDIDTPTDVATTEDFQDEEDNIESPDPSEEGEDSDAEDTETNEDNVTEGDLPESEELITEEIEGVTETDKELSETEENKDTTKLAEYTNGYLNLSFKYPDNWFLTERTQDGLNVLREISEDGVINIKEKPVPEVIPIADIENSRGEDRTIIKVLIYPSTNQPATQNQPMPNLFTTTGKIEGEATKESKDLGNYTPNTVQYQVIDFGNTYYGVQSTVKVGENIIVFSMYEKVQVDTESSIGILESIINSLTI